MSEAVEIHRSNVRFTDGDATDGSCLKCGEDAQEKKRNLTMKYGQKQQQIVKKRLKVEYWLDSELQKLYEINNPNETYPCDPDLDELMEIENEGERRKSVMELLKSCKQTDTVIQNFIDELLEKMKTLI